MYGIIFNETAHDTAINPSDADIFIYEGNAVLINRVLQDPTDRNNIVKIKHNGTGQLALIASYPSTIQGGMLVLDANINGVELYFHSDNSTWYVVSTSEASIIIGG